MNIDERLEKMGLFMERLGERHEGLTQSVELLVSMHNEHKRQFEEHRKEFAEQRKDFAENKRLVTGAIESIAETNRQLTQMLAAMRNDQVRMRDEQLQDRGEFRDAMMRLSVIAEAHQDTLDDHEKRLGRPAA